jgi:hypothetical protein
VYESAASLTIRIGSPLGALLRSAVKSEVNEATLIVSVFGVLSPVDEVESAQPVKIGTIDPTTVMPASDAILCMNSLRVDISSVKD